MAQRFEKAITRKAFSTGAWLLFLLPLPLIPAAIISLLKGDALHLTVSLGAYAVYLYSALMTRQALKAEANYSEQSFAVRPSMKGKQFAGILTAVTTGVLAYLGTDQGLIMSAIYTSLSGLGFHLAYGFQMRNPPPVTTRFHSDDPEIAETLAQAEAKIITIELAASQLSSLELAQRLERITHKAREILHSIADNPKDIRKARKFMYVYLDGAQKVSQGYARTHRQIHSGELEESFRRVLVTIEDVFVEQHKKLLEHDVLDLDVQIEVLKTQLENEGVI